MSNPVVIALAAIIGIVEIVIGGYIIFSIADGTAEIIEDTQVLQLGIGIVTSLVLLGILIVLVIGIGMETLELLYTVFDWDMPQALLEWSAYK